jgi:hypothetical protein
MSTYISTSKYFEVRHTIRTSYLAKDGDIPDLARRRCGRLYIFLSRYGQATVETDFDILDECVIMDYTY